MVTTAPQVKSDLGELRCTRQRKAHELTLLNAAPALQVRFVRACVETRLLRDERDAFPVHPQVWERLQDNTVSSQRKKQVRAGQTRAPLNSLLRFLSSTYAVYYEDETAASARQTSSSAERFIGALRRISHFLHP